MHPPPLHSTDIIGPLIASAVFIALMSFMREPTRRTFNAILVAGAGGAYLSGGGFGPWEVVYPVVATPVAFLGLQSYSFIGAAWLMHSGWDIAHHLYGNPIWPFMPTSSFGCMMFDAVIAMWFIGGGRSVWGRDVR